MVGRQVLNPMTQGSAVRIPAVAESSFGIKLTF